MKGSAVFWIGVLCGAGLTVGAYRLLPSPYAEALDHIAEQDREIESQRRQISTQGEMLLKLGVRPHITAVTDLPRGRTVAPPFLPRPAATDDSLPAPSRLTLEFDYADLMDSLHLPAAQRSLFLDLLSRRGEPGAETALETFLASPSDYATFQTYRRQLPERRSVRPLRLALTGTVHPLTPDQEAALIKLFARERKAQRLPASLDDAIAAHPENSLRLLQSQARMGQRILAQATGILQPEQIDVLRRLQSEEFQRLKLASALAPKN